ncbi:MAG: DNA gyrase inhibitor YacG [Planctomycetaceae bacterium]|nr:DNA gyrase inhibitor YacG [Planctomycetaceae bacterium]
MIQPQTCPICDKQMQSSKEEDHFPFCSKRCRDIDLYRWSNGEYVIQRDLSPEEAAMMEAMENGEIPPDMLDL